MRRDDAVALLASVFEEADVDHLVKTLDATEGNVELAIEHLVQEPRSNKRARQSPASRSAQSLEPLIPADGKKAKPMSMNAWLGEVVGISESSSGIGSPSIDPQTNRSRLPEKILTSQSTNPDHTDKRPRRALHEVLGNPGVTNSLGTPKHPKMVSSLPPRFLATPKDVSTHLPCCSLFYNVLSKPLATRLYLKMLADCQGQGQDKQPWTRNRWWLNEREVESPHSTAFYVSHKEEQADDCALDYAESAQYWYAGKPLKVDAKPRYFLPEMEEAKCTIEPIVNQMLRNDPDMLEVAQRKTPLNPVRRFSSEWHGDWKANVAASNCYRGSKESVGWHADQLTYLGPYPTIASLSLGTGRQFRLRAVPNVNESSAPPPCTYSVFLPHNSLLIMHGGCQERYKHCVPSQKTLDVFKPSSISESHIERINITFRFYRPDFQPTRKGEIPGKSNPTAPLGTPKCHCGIPTLLRADQKGKSSGGPNRSSDLPGPTSKSIVHPGPQPEYKLQFFWQCQGGLQNQGKGCGFFRLLDMQREYRGPLLGAERAAELSIPSLDERSSLGMIQI